LKEEALDGAELALEEAVGLSEGRRRVDEFANNKIFAVVVTSI
jgi:hypothetical protein